MLPPKAPSPVTAIRVPPPAFVKAIEPTVWVGSFSPIDRQRLPMSFDIQTPPLATEA